MNKVTLFAACALMFCACGSQKEKAPIVKFVDEAVAEYPNYRSNELAEKSLTEKLANRVKSASDLSGVKFEFVKLIENPQTGAHSALFESTGCNSDIESDAEGGNYIITDLCIVVLGVVDDEVAAKLSCGREYAISGELHAWDEGDVFNLYYNRTYRGFHLGTYILDNMSVTQYEE